MMTEEEEKDTDEREKGKAEKEMRIIDDFSRYRSKGVMATEPIPQATTDYRQSPKRCNTVADGTDPAQLPYSPVLQLSEVSDGCYNLNLGGDAGGSAKAAGVDDTNLIDTANYEQSSPTLKQIGRLTCKSLTFLSTLCLWPRVPTRPEHRELTHCPL